MAEKILQTRIINKHTSYDIATTNETFIPKLGEIVLAKLDVQQNNGQTIPTFLMKVGDGEKSLKALNWLHAPASDVYSWAKKEHLEYDALPQTLKDEIDVLQAAVGGEGSVAKMIASAIEAAIAELDSESDGEGSFVKAVTQADGKVSVTYGKIEISDVEGLTDKIAEYRTSSVQDEIDAAQNEAIAAAKKAGEDAAAAVAGDLADYEASNDARVKAIEDEIDTFGDIVTHDVAEFATAEQGAKADAAAVKADVDTALGERYTKTEADDKFETIENVDLVRADITNITKDGGLIATAKSEAIAAAKTETQTQIATFKTNVTDVLDGRIEDVETQLANVSNVMDFVGAGAALPAVETSNKGDVFVINEGENAGKEYVFDGTAWVEFGYATGNENAIAALQGRMDTAEADIDALEDAVEDHETRLDAIEPKVEGWDATKTTVDTNKETWDKAGTALQAADLDEYAKSEDVTAEISAAVAPKLDSSVFNEYKTDRTLTDTQINEALAGKEAAGAAAAAEAAAKADTKEKVDALTITVNTNAQTAADATKQVADDLAAEILRATAAEEAAAAKGQQGIDDAASALQYAKTVETTKVDKNTDDIAAVQENFAKVKATETDGKTTYSLVVGAQEDVIIFDCGGVE